MERIPVVFSMIICCLILITPDISRADDADVLPKGVSTMNLRGQFYKSFNERYDPDGNVEDIAANFNSVLDSTVFSDISAVEQAFGMDEGSGNLGESIVSFKREYKIVEWSYFYGLTDKLSAGIIVPYWWVKNTVTTNLDTTNATVGKSAIGVGFAAPLVPLAGGGPFGDAEELTTEDVLDILSEGMDINEDGTTDISGYGYKRFKTWSGSGVGDIKLGLKYQYAKTETWRHAFTGGIQLPTGKLSDPDNLAALDIDSNAYALLFHFQNDYTGIKNVVLNGTFRYNMILPFKETVRIPDDVNDSLAINKEKVKIDIGDKFELEASAKYEVIKGVTIGALYNYGWKLEDKVSGDQDFAYEALEEETKQTEQIYIVSLTYSTMPLFMEKKFPLPLNAYLSYRNRFAGTNNVAKSEYTGVGLQAFF